MRSRAGAGAHCAQRAQIQRQLIEEIRRVIEPVIVAGLANRARRNWYPVDAEDLLRAAHKVGASRDEVLQMLERCGFNRSYFFAVVTAN